jgi:hypothetical protein
MLIPTYGRAKPKRVFGELDSRSLKADAGRLRFQMNGRGDTKLSIRTIATTGRAGYVYGRSQTKWDLIIRNFCVNPSGVYVDVPWDNPSDEGYCLQACSANGIWGAFSELEYHLPAVGRGTGRASCEDVSQVWAFRGSPRSVRSAAALLLGFS